MVHNNIVNNQYLAENYFVNDKVTQIFKKIVEPRLQHIHIGCIDSCWEKSILTDKFSTL